MKPAICYSSIAHSYSLGRSLGVRSDARSGAPGCVRWCPRLLAYRLARWFAAWLPRSRASWPLRWSKSLFYTSANTLACGFAFRLGLLGGFRRGGKNSNSPALTTATPSSLGP
jgi:hypothetical protein